MKNKPPTTKGEELWNMRTRKGPGGEGGGGWGRGEREEEEENGKNCLNKLKALNQVASGVSSKMAQINEKSYL